MAALSGNNSPAESVVFPRHLFVAPNSTVNYVWCVLLTPTARRGVRAIDELVRLGERDLREQLELLYALCDMTGKKDKHASDAAKAVSKHWPELDVHNAITCEVVDFERTHLLGPVITHITFPSED